MNKLNKSGMQENDFEKQVKSMMEEFGVAPPVTAWEKVRTRIGGDKRRKRYFFFFLLAGLLVAGFAGYVSLNNNNDDEQITVAISNKNNNLEKNSAKESASSINPKHSFTTDSLTKGTVGNDGNHQPTQIKKLNSDLNEITPLVATKTVLPKTNSTGNILSKQKIVQPANDANRINSTTETNTVITHENGSTEMVASQEKSLVTDTVATTSTQKNITSIIDSAKQNMQTQTDAAPVKDLQKKKNIYTIPKWQFGIDVMYGKSFLLQQTSSAKSAVTVSLADPGTVLSNTNAPAYINKPFTKSDAYGFGFIVKRKIMRSAVTETGLSFTHLSVKSGTNKELSSNSFFSRNDSLYSLNNYVRPGDSSSFTSNYNFIELPLYFEQTIFHTKQFALTYNAGFSVRQLIAAKALLYNKNNYAYFTNNSLLNKTQFQMGAGLNFQFNISKHNFLFAGPQFSYSLNNLMKNDNNPTFHFITYGLHAGILLHK